MRCKWCANPENLTGKIQTGFIEHLCSRCGRCVGVCQSGAIVEDLNAYRVDRKKCSACGACVAECLYGALVQYGEEMTSGEVFQKVRHDKMFYDSSGGGVTVSGGEPLLSSRFVSELFLQCKNEGIDTCVETCGHVPWDAFERVLPVTDHFYFDLKHMDSRSHRQHTAGENTLILNNAERLVMSGANILFRQPLIPGVNDSMENIEATASFMRIINPKLKLELMPYHRLGQAKYAVLDMPNPMAEMSVMASAEVEAVRAKYEAFGVRCTISR